MDSLHRSGCDIISILFVYFVVHCCPYMLLISMESFLYLCAYINTMEKN